MVKRSLPLSALKSLAALLGENLFETNDELC